MVDLNFFGCRPSGQTDPRICQPRFPELTRVLRLVRATSYNTRACVIAGGSRHSINTSTCTWQQMRHYIYRLRAYNILVSFCRLFHVIIFMTSKHDQSHCFNMIIYITQVGVIKGEQEAYASQSPIWVVTHRQKKNGSKMMRRCRSFLIMCSGGSRGGGGLQG